MGAPPPIINDQSLGQLDGLWWRKVGELMRGIMVEKVELVSGVGYDRER